MRKVCPCNTLNSFAQLWTKSCMNGFAGMLHVCFVLPFLCRMRSIPVAAHRDHFVWGLSVRYSETQTSSVRRTWPVKHLSVRWIIGHSQPGCPVIILLTISMSHHGRVILLKFVNVMVTDLFLQMCTNQNTMIYMQSFCILLKKWASLWLIHITKKFKDQISILIKYSREKKTNIDSKEITLIVLLYILLQLEFLKI